MPKNYALPQLISPRQPFGPPTFPKRMIWTASSLKLFRSCKRKAFWKLFFRLKPRTKDKNLVIGGIFHECVAQWYRNKRSSMAAVLRKYQRQLEEYLETKGGFYSQNERDKFDIAIANFGGMMLAYEDQYDADRQKWKIDRELIEKQFVVHFDNFDYAGKIDLVTTRYKHQRGVEHKTQSHIRTDYITRLPIDTQCRGYMLGCTEGLGLQCDEILYDLVAKSKWRRKSNESIEEFNQRNAERYMAQPGKFFYREPIPYSQDAVECFKHELRQTDREYHQLRKDVESRTSPWSWGTNDDICDKYFKLCEYFELCTEGLDRATARGFDQHASMHEELEEIEDED